MPPAPVVEGAYQVTSVLALTPEVFLPTPAADLVVSLRSFSTAPAHTLIGMADAAGVPAVGELRAVLPDVLESRLEGWIDDEIAKVRLGGAPITQLAGHAAALAETTLTTVALHSELVLVEGARTATHRLRALDFRPAGLEGQVVIGGLPGELVSATTAISTTNDKITMGAHSFGVRYGAHAWAAIDATIAAQTGATLRAALGGAIRCPSVAATVASKCVVGVCVGHAAELTEICERGLDEVVARARAEMESLRLDVIALESGAADITAAGKALAAGVWTAKLNGGQGLRPVPATFSATR